jgi:hypothetical protein
MKSSVLIILATLLATAILAPSVIMLTKLDEKSAIAVDFGEEEKKEEKKEAKEKDFFIDSYLNSLTQLKKEKTIISVFYIENSYNTSLSIFLPPPKHIL